MSYKGIAKGKMIELEEPLPYTEGQPVNVEVKPVEAQLQVGSPVAVKQAMHEPPHLTGEDINELEQAIEEAKLPVRDERMFAGETESMIFLNDL